MHHDDKLARVLQFKPLLELCKLIWAGTFRASMDNTVIGLVYVGLIAITLLTGVSTGRWGFMLLVILGVAIGLGIRQYRIEAPLKKRRLFFFNIFVTMGFYAKGDIYPYYITETKIDDYTTGIAFATFIPVSSWLARKDELEMYFNMKIMDIRETNVNQRSVHVLVQRKPLPDYFEWKDKYLDTTNPKYNYPHSLLIGDCHMGINAMNLLRHPHAFIAGETGSGKSNILKCFIHQALHKKFDVVLIDFKRGVSFAEFNKSITIYYEYPEVVAVLEAMVEETKNRLDRFRETGVDNIVDYNSLIESRSGSAASSGYMKRTIVFIDELAELLKTRDKAVSNALNDSIETLTRLSRAVGIHLIMGIQRPDSTIVSGQIKNNVSFRVCGRFVDKEPSRIMLGNDRASSLPNIKGRFIVKDDNMYEVQAFYFSAPKPTSKIATEAPQSPTEPILFNDREIDGNMEAEPPVEASQPDTPESMQAEAPKEPEAQTKAEEKPSKPDSIDFDFSSFKK